MKSKILLMTVLTLAAGIGYLFAGQDNDAATLTAQRLEDSKSSEPRPSGASVALPQALHLMAAQDRGADPRLLEAPPNDECTNAIVISGPFPSNVTGTTIEATIDCPDGFDQEAVWYQFFAPFAFNEVTIDYCLTVSQVNLAAVMMYLNCPIDGVTCLDYIEAYQAYGIPCGNGQNRPYRRWIGLPGPAIYYFPVYFNVPTDFGFTINVAQYAPVSVTCPGGAQQEQEACGADANGGCLMPPGMEQFESISCGTPICGTYWSNNYIRDTDWYELDLALRGFVRWKAVGEAPTRIWIYNGTGGCEGTFLGSVGAEPGDTASLELELMPGTYWFVVGTDGWFDMLCGGTGMFTNDYVALLTCELGTPEIAADPTTIIGEAFEGFTDTETLTVSNVGSGRLIFAAQATQNISVMAARQEPSDRDVGEQQMFDQSMGSLRDILSPYAPEDVSALYEHFPVDLSMRHEGDGEPPMILVDCPGNGIPEAENCGDDVNGGCAMVPGTEYFEPFACNTTVCGKSWSNGTVRDTDWYLLQLTESRLFTYAVTAEFPLLVLLILPGTPGSECEDFEALFFATALPGDTARIIASLPAGDYWLWAGPTAWYDMPCDGSGDYGNDYVASIKCEAPWLTIDIISGVIHQGDPAVDISVLMDATNLLPGIYTGRIRLTSNDLDTSPLDVPVTFNVLEVFEYLPGDANMGFSTWPPAVTGTDIIYLVNYFKRDSTSQPCVFDGFWASADANGDCTILPNDIIYLVQYLRGVNPAPEGCPDYPHIDPTEEDYPACTVIPYPYRKLGESEDIGLR